MTDASKPFAGRAAIVTGATRGIGRAIALELARRGANIAFNYAKSVEAAETLKAEIEAMDVRALGTQCDVASTNDAAEMVKQTKDAFGRIDFLVNNAGIVRDNLILRMKEEDWDAVMNTNLKGAWNFARAALRVMLRRREDAALDADDSSAGRCQADECRLDGRPARGPRSPGTDGFGRPPASGHTRAERDVVKR